MTPFMKFNDFCNNVYLPYVLRAFELSTYHRYIKDLIAIKEQIGNKRMIFITQKTIKGLLKTLESRDIKQSTVRAYFKVIKAIFNYAVANRNILKNPCSGIWVKEGLSGAGAFTSKEVKILAEHIRVNYPTIYLAVYLAVNTGMRRGEILGLIWANVDFDRKEIMINQSLCRTVAGTIYIKTPKTENGKRIIAISSEVVEVLRKTKSNSGCDYVVSDYSGKTYMDPQYLTNYFGRAVRECNVTKRRFHDLRHTHASLLLAAGVSINVVSARLGHANIDITLKVYSHMLPGQQHAAAEAFSKGMKNGFIST